MLFTSNRKDKKMPALFVKAGQHRIFQDIVEQIQSAILDGNIPAGEKLPPERELVYMFETSRPTLREALRVLEQKGLIEIRLGVKGGAYVKAPNGELMAENLDMLIRTQSVSLIHLGEFRQGIEGLVAELAAERATTGDIAILKKLIAEAKHFRDCGVERWGDFIKVDEKIHLEIADMAGNALYSFVLHSIHSNINRYFSEFLKAGTNKLEENYCDLCRLVAAIEDHDSIAAGKLAQDHVRRFNRHMEKYSARRDKLAPLTAVIDKD